MRSSVFVVAVLAVARPSTAIFQDLLLQPLQHFQHIMQPQPPQPQYYQYQQYRRSSEPQPLPAPVQPVQHGVYANSRPVVYQWQPNSYGSAYSYGGNPLSSFLQNSWFPWASASRQPLQQQPQPLSAGVASSPQQQQPQQPLQAFWAFLPWNSNMQQQQQQQQQPQQPGPILSFLQNPSAMLPWGQQHAQRPGVVYTSPLAPSSIVAEAPVSASLSAAPALQLSSEAMGEAAPAGSVKPTGVVLDDIPATAAFSGNGIRRIALHDVLHDVHPDALPCAQDAQ